MIPQISFTLPPKCHNPKEFATQWLENALKRCGVSETVNDYDFKVRDKQGVFTKK